MIHWFQGIDYQSMLNFHMIMPEFWGQLFYGLSYFFVFLVHLALIFFLICSYSFLGTLRESIWAACIEESKRDTQPEWPYYPLFLKYLTVWSMPETERSEKWNYTWSYIWCYHKKPSRGGAKWLSPAAQNFWILASICFRYIDHAHTLLCLSLINARTTWNLRLCLHILSLISSF
jgi:hypothetical protein